uniref:Uncharacterized protein n=1 Tax=Oryza meridionalis TaxID=40149 RepID=A0A0E0EST2_9ORYZ
MGGSEQDCWPASGWEPWTAPALEDLLPQLSLEEQLRLQSRLREHHRVLNKGRDKDSPPRFSSSLRSECGTSSSLAMSATLSTITMPNTQYGPVHFELDFSFVLINFIAISQGPCVVPRQLLGSLPQRAKRSSASLLRCATSCPTAAALSGRTCRLGVPGAEKPASSSSSDLPRLPSPFTTVEACTIIEEPLGKYRKSCAFCRGHLDILHPKGRKFVCGNDKYRMEQRLLPCGSIGLEMPFTCRPDPASPNVHEEEGERQSDIYVVGLGIVLHCLCPMLDRPSYFKKIMISIFVVVR